MSNMLMEILVDIASKLYGKDLGNFRLASSQYASAGIYFLARNGLSILNTLGCLREFKELLACEIIANSTKEVRFVHGQWPVCSREE